MLAISIVSALEANGVTTIQSGNSRKIDLCSDDAKNILYIGA